MRIKLSLIDDTNHTVTGSISPQELFNQLSGEEETAVLKHFPADVIVMRLGAQTLLADIPIEDILAYHAGELVRKKIEP